MLEKIFDMSARQILENQRLREEIKRLRGLVALAYDALLDDDKRAKDSCAERLKAEILADKANSNSTEGQKT